MSMNLQSSVVRPESSAEIVTEKLGMNGQHELPSILVHSGHGDEWSSVSEWEENGQGFS